jgi:adenylate kinase family enzyme
MRRALVLGSSGSGKSTFARRLSRITGIPLVSIDAIYWQPGWRPSDPKSFETSMTQIANQPSWIIDGNYLASGSGEIRGARADTIFWFDLPRWVCMSGVLLRIARGHGRVRPEMAEGCPERFDPEFIRYVWTFRARRRSELLAFFEALRPDQNRIRFTSRSAADSYLASRWSGPAVVGEQ